MKIKLLMPVSELPILGRHYQANVLAALAIGYAYGLPMAVMLERLSNLRGYRTAANWYVNVIKCAGITIPREQT